MSPSTGLVRERGMEGQVNSGAALQGVQEEMQSTRQSFSGDRVLVLVLLWMPKSRGARVFCAK